jgi:metallo-beta-lactamase family protein
MAEGGRVLHHLKAALPDPRNTVLFAGYQGVGTRGRRLVDGEKTVKIHGEWVPVVAAIEHIDSMSAHADAGEIMRWLKGFTRAPQQTFIVHGEPAAQDALAARIHAELGWPTMTPEHREVVQI